MSSHGNAPRRDRERVGVATNAIGLGKPKIEDPWIPFPAPTLI